ncbi:MAG: glycosyltransferase [Planctomycetaceae bacterium]|nr:glycosyltransferase [Planctomycetaceae bacterium]
MSVDPRTKRVLFVSYLFPPVGGVGVLRVAKFVKFLPEYGWSSSVLTVSNPSVPLFDESLLRDIPEDTIIRKAKTREPGYAVKSSVAAIEGSPSTAASLKSTIKNGIKAVAKSLLQPDAQILWYPAAVKEGLRLLTETPHDVIVASGPPFTNLVVGAALARKTGLPLVLDYRDEWDISNAYWENKQAGRLSNWIQRRMQSRAVRAAKAIVATTPLSAAALQQVSRRAGSRATAGHIYNGFDTSDFSANTNDSERTDYGNGVDRFRLSFAGTLWELTSIEPFVEGVRRLCELAPALAERLEIVIAGRRAGRQDEYIDRLSSLSCQTVRLGYLEHAEAVRLMVTSDSLLLLLSDLPHADRVISSKVFEYMAAKKPVFAVTPEGDQCDVLSEHPGATICSPANADQIADALASRLEEHRLGAMPDGLTWDFSQFERRAQAGQLADLLDSLTVDRELRKRNLHRPIDVDVPQSPRASESLT